METKKYGVGLVKYGFDPLTFNKLLSKIEDCIMLKTIKLNERSFLIIEYYYRPKADEQEVYQSSPDTMFECEHFVGSVKLLQSDGIIEFNAKQFHRMAKEFIELKEDTTALPAKKIEI